ncbi:MAG: hypothetical protein K9M07_04720 [Simkaniaceae bacterium]|nr:hypothetical protein [Simkaniaceae bacterium]
MIQAISLQADYWGTWGIYQMTLPLDHLVDAIFKNNEPRDAVYEWPPIQILASGIYLLMGLIPALLGCTLSLIGRYLREDNFYHIQGDQTAVDKPEIKVMSWNTGQIALSPLIDATEPRDRRIQQQIKKIIDSECDIFFGQECFGYSAHQMAAGLKKDFSDIYLRPGGYLFGLDPGLLIASKIPIEKVEFHPFAPSPLSRSSVQFGFFVVTTAKAIYIATHFDVGNGIDNAQLHIDEFNEIREITASCERAIYLCGDLNLTESKDRIFIKEALNTEDTRNTCSNQLEVDRFQRPLQEAKLDYLDCLQGEETVPENLEIEKTSLSDHWMISRVVSCKK